MSAPGPGQPEICWRTGRPFPTPPFSRNTPIAPGAPAPECRAVPAEESMTRPVTQLTRGRSPMGARLSIEHLEERSAPSDLFLWLGDTPGGEEFFLGADLAVATT